MFEEAKNALVLVSAPNVKVTHTLAFTNEDTFFEVVKQLKDQGYTLDDVGDLIATVSKVIDNNEEGVVAELQSVYDQVVDNHGLYKSYELVSA